MEIDKMPIMTDTQAYAAMFNFLEEYWKRGQSEDIGNLLSSLSLLPDGASADPAMDDDWKNAVEYALKGGKAGSLTLGSTKELR